MTDFVTQCATAANVTSWFAGIPSTVPITDRYIAELAAGNYDVDAAFTGKTVLAVGAIIIRAAATAKPNLPLNPARLQASGSVSLRPGFSGQISFGSSLANGLVVEDIQLHISQSGAAFVFNNGSMARRIVGAIPTIAGTMTFNGNSSAIDSLFYSAVASTPAAFNGTGSVDGCTFLTFTDRASVSLQGTFQNSIFKNNVAMNLAASPTVDPWPTPPTSFFSTSSSNNATSFATLGNCPGTSPVSGVVPANALVDVSSVTNLNARPKSGSVLFNAGVVSSTNGGIDWYSDVRSGTTPTIGAVELTSSPTLSQMAGNVTMDDLVASGVFSSIASSMAGNVTLAEVVASGDMGASPGVITSAVFKNFSGGVQANVTIPNVCVLRLSDRTLILALINQVTNGSGVLSISNAALIPGTAYLLVTWDGGAVNFGAQPYTAA